MAPNKRNPNWGGRRKGAGAPKGNLNAFRHGGRSRQLAQLAALLAATPATQTALIALAKRHLDDQPKAEEVAAILLERLFLHAEAIARGEKSRGPFAKYLKEDSPALSEAEPESKG
jgi:hypothetical protein